MTRCPHGVDTSERGCVKCAMGEPMPYHEQVGAKYRWEREAQIDAAVARERARCRAIVLRNHGNDWTANQTLREIDEP